MEPIGIRRQLARYAREAFKNGICLLADAIKLYKANRWGTAFFLATISIEEVGKCLLANDAIYHLDADEADIESTAKRLKLTSSHRIKQLKFARESMLRLPTEFLKLVMDKKLESLKQRAIYVDMELREMKTRLAIATPKGITEAKARRQICLAHEGILDIVQGSLDGNYIFEMGMDLPPLDKATRLKLRRMWNASYKANRSSFHQEILKRIGNSA